MKYMKKMLGLLAVAAIALMAFAGAASATTLTSPSGTTLGVGSVIESEGSIKLTGTITITCTKTKKRGEVVSQGGPGTTVVVQYSEFKIEDCHNHTVTVTKKGTEVIHVIPAWPDDVTTTSFEMTVLMHSFFLGTVHCIYTTNETTVGALTDSSTTKSTATVDITSAQIPRTATDGACGEHSTLEGSYTITTPDSLYVD